jgi:hypothetical protein
VTFIGRLLGWSFGGADRQHDAADAGHWDIDPVTGPQVVALRQVGNDLAR